MKIQRNVFKIGYILSFLFNYMKRRRRIIFKNPDFQDFYIFKILISVLKRCHPCIHQVQRDAVPGVVLALL